MRTRSVFQLFAFTLLAGLNLLTALRAKNPLPPQQTDVFVAGKEGYHTFRIPSLIVTSKGTLLAFCEGRKNNRSDHGNLDLVVKRSEDGGKSWSGLSVVYEEGGAKEITIGNPCPVVDPATGVIWMPFTRDNNDVFMTHSKDDGKTWAKPTKITSDVKKKNWTWYATGPGVGIALKHGKHKGRLLIPCDHREPIKGKAVTHSHCIYSDDHGRTWKLGESVAPHTNECQAVELSDGSVMINMRNYWGRTGGVKERDKKRAVALSEDGGHSWREISFDEDLIEPLCQASLHKWVSDSGQQKMLLFSNPASRTTRHRMTIRYSRDEGKTWSEGALLHGGPAAYSCLAHLPQGRALCLYERGEKSAYEKITFARFSVSWVTSAK